MEGVSFEQGRKEFLEAIQRRRSQVVVPVEMETGDSVEVEQTEDAQKDFTERYGEASSHPGEPVPWDVLESE